MAPSEDYNKGPVKRENDALLQLIRTRLVGSGLSIHAAFFCFAGGLSRQDLEALKIYLHTIGKLPWIAVLTNAESRLPEDIANAKRQIKENSQSNQLIDSNALHFSGALGELQEDEPFDEDFEMRSLRTIAGYRTELLQYITTVAANQPVSPSKFSWRPAAEQRAIPPAVVTKSVSELPDVLKARTQRIADWRAQLASLSMATSKEPANKTGWGQWLWSCCTKSNKEKSQSARYNVASLGARYLKKSKSLISALMKKAGLVRTI